MSHRILLVVVGLFVACSVPEPSPVEIEPRVSPSPACTSPSTADGLIEMPAGYSVATRRYRVDVPPWWNGTDPIGVVYFFHACGGDETAGTSLNMYIPVANLTDEDAIIVTGESATSCWDLSPEGEDVEYIARLRAEIEGAYCIDRDEIHHSGISSGGFAAQGYGCRFGATSIFEAAGGIHHAEPEATLYGLHPTEVPEPSDCQHPVPVIMIHGANDNTVGYNTRAIPARDAWLEINGCEPTTSPFTFGVDLCQGLPQPCSCVVYDDCDSGAPVVWCVHNGGHSWPGQTRNGTALWLGQWDEPIDWPDGGEESSSSSSSSGEDSTSTGEESSSSSSSSSEDSSSSGEPSNPSGCATLLDEDTFDGPGLDQARWTPMTWVDATVAVDDGELAVYVPTTAGSRATVRTDVARDGSDFAATIELASLPATLLNADIRMEVSDPQWRWVGLKTSWGNLQARSNTTSYALTPFSLTNHRFWRIRFVSGVVHFETSADGETFVELTQVASPLSGNVLVTLRTSYGPGSSAETVRFDNFAVGTGCGP